MSCWTFYQLTNMNRYKVGGWGHVITCESIMCDKSFHFSCAGFVHTPDKQQSFICHYCRQTEMNTLTNQSSIPQLQSRTPQSADPIKQYHIFVGKQSIELQLLTSVHIRVIGLIPSDSDIINKLMQRQSNIDSYYIDIDYNITHTNQVDHQSYQQFTALITELKQQSMNMIVQYIKPGDVILSTFILLPYSDSMMLLMVCCIICILMERSNCTDTCVSCRMQSIASGDQLTPCVDPPSNPIEYTPHDLHTSSQYVAELLSEQSYDDQFSVDKLSSSTTDEFKMLLQEYVDLSFNVIYMYHSLVLTQHNSIILSIDADVM